jgi:tRNA(Ile)-lysidine synthase
MRWSNPLIQRFESSVGRLLDREVEGPLVVALSGGLDSCVLLHLLRFTLGSWPDLLAAHFDHRMRAGSAGDAAWVRGLCQAWQVPIVMGSADRALHSEADARAARYEFLTGLAERQGEGARVLTAHHADDQAETVLFRVLRGTGISGLTGIPVAREPGIVRPLLGLWREDLEAYASFASVPWREDESNLSDAYARNVLRREVLPLAEKKVAAGARQALVRLSRLAAENEAAWDEVLPDLIIPLAVVREEPGPDDPRLSWDRQASKSLPHALRRRVLRYLAASEGYRLDERVTGLAADFLGTAKSGGRLCLGGGVELHRVLDRFALRRAARGVSVRDDPLAIRSASTGAGQVILGGRAVSVAWSVVEGGEDRVAECQEVFMVDDLDFPLMVRGREPGDRIVLRGGSRKVKKILLEARIPIEARAQLPLLVDRLGRVLWVAGVARSTGVRAVEEGHDGAQTLTVGVG